MITQTFDIMNETGLHARPATDLCKLCKSYSGEISIVAGEKRINPRSVVSILTSGVVKGASIDVTINGADEESFMALLKNFFDNLTD